MMKEYGWTYDELLKQIYKLSTSKLHSYTNRYMATWFKEYCTQKAHFSIYTFREVVKKEMDKYSIFEHNFMLYMLSAYIALAISLTGLVFNISTDFLDKMEVVQNNLESIQDEQDIILKNKTLSEDKMKEELHSISNKIYKNMGKIKKDIKEYNSQMLNFGIMLAINGVVIIFITYRCIKCKYRYNKYYNIYIAICEYINNSQKQRDKEDCSYI